MNKRPSKNRNKPTKMAPVEPAVSVTAPETRRSQTKHAYAIAVVIIASVCALLYAWTADYPMVFDDYVYLETNPLVKEARSFGYLSELREFAMRPSKEGFAPDVATNFILRPVAYATFHLNYLFDAFRPRWFRVVNIGIHAVNGMLIFTLVRILLARTGSLSRRSELFISGTAALMFVAHPMATESVTYIIQRFTSLGAMFYLSTLCLYFASMNAVTPKGRAALRMGAVATLILGMLTKESVVTAPLVAVMLDWLVARRTTNSKNEPVIAATDLPFGERLLYWMLVRSRLCKAMREAWPLLICLPIVPTLVLLAAWGRHGNEVTIGSALNVTNLNEDPWNHWQFAITEITVVMNYLRKLVWPSDLNLDPEWPLYESMLRGPVILATEGIAIIIGVAVWLFRRFRGDVRFAVSLAFVLWFFATIVVSSGLVPLPDLMAEHRTYLPSVGIFISIACLLDWLLCWTGANRSGRWLAPIMAGTAAVALAFSTAQRNKVWRTAVTLWEDTAAKSPGNSRVWCNLGVAYIGNREFEKAVTAYKKAIALNPSYETALLNLASALNGLHRSKEALEALASLEKLNPHVSHSPDVLCCRSVAFIESGKIEEGIQILNSIVTQVPSHRMSHVVLGMIYSQTNHPGKAVEHYQRALRLQPADPEVRGLMQKAELAINSR